MKFVLFLAAALAVVACSRALSCTAQYECSPVTTDYNYVACTGGKCVCLSSQGFAGNATVGNPCACGTTVYWVGSQPYCIDVAATAAALNTAAVNKAAIAALYNSLVYPQAGEIIADPSLAPVQFSSDLKGRIDPLGTFNNALLMFEYFWGLAATPVIYVGGVTIQDMVAEGLEVYSDVDIHFYSPFTGTFLYNITQTGRFLFNEAGQVASVFLNIPNLNNASGGTPQDVAVGFACDIMLGDLFVPGGTCPPSLDPTGVLGFYRNISQCTDFLMHDVPYGTADYYNSADCGQCRITHSLLTPVDKVHCVHAGIYGGYSGTFEGFTNMQVCVDTSYFEYGYSVQY